MAKYRKKPVIIEAIQYKIVEEIPCKYGVAKKQMLMKYHNL